mmetsp:Transcript_24756/g.41866  ORF Transcript_24756/g.41866 Transcript_24756/m.41866 type:complete len:701 (+) Transcript_24756:228-2330(+)|eukprot:CAMPEP_0114450622 /NCGR_PEP_ID=MMETSP0104-20121206/557_1 /TAXON_ID=37642 ORGANISM="Paraphysomonas imperforata, Strain PA2" /NCGR_SAMPLE_ID=MMETSP0104 /ASSEMBLY_ACC=CAM_ASM_000202 /LENGTH=700 /DNA_ID=CAMNT_0001622773 /DNA_START=153 /DNA_END=2255 /DNA_ORIENTATION=+
MDVPGSGQMHHLLAGLTSHSLVERVCAASTESLREADVPIDWDSLRELWLAKLRAKSELPHMKSAGIKRDGVSEVLPPVPGPATSDVHSIAVGSSDTSSAPLSSEKHWRLTEPLPPGRGAGRGVQGRPLPHMPVPLLFSGHAEGPALGRATPKISYQYSSSSAVPPMSTVEEQAVGGPETHVTSLGGAGSGLDPPDSRQPQPDAPRMVAVASVIPLHGTRVLVEMERDGGRVFQQCRVCRTIADADILWCGKALLREPPASKPLLPLATSPLTAYCVPSSLPKRFAGGVLPVKLRSSSGEEMSLNWPFCRAPGQAVDAFEAAVRDIRVIDVELPASLPIDNDNEDGSILSSIVSQEFGEYEADMILEAHRVFRFEGPTVEAEPCTVQSHDCDPEEDSEGEDGPHHEVTISSVGINGDDIPGSITAAGKMSTTEFDDFDDHAMNLLLSHGVGDGDSADMSSIASVLATNQLLSGSHEESIVGIHKRAGSTDSAAHDKSLFDIMMGSCDSEHRHDRSGGGQGSAEGTGAVGTTATDKKRPDNSNVAGHTGPAMKKKRVSGEEARPSLLLQTSDREQLARQLFLAEWEADQHLARAMSARRHAKFRIAGSCSRSGEDGSTCSASIGSVTEEDTTTIPLEHPQATVVGTCRSMVRHAESWQVRLHHVHLRLRDKEYVAKTCKVRLKLPDYLSNDRRVRKTSTLS